MEHTPQQTQAYREWDAEAYHQLSDPQFEIAMQLLDTLNLTGHETIIDAGCGSGRVTEKLLERLPQGKVIGVDISQNMLAHADHLLRPLYGERIDLISADLQTFCLPEIADGVFSSTALHFVLDHASLFANLARSLKPGGFLAAQFASEESAQAPLLARLQHVFSDAEFAPYATGSEFYGADEISTRQFLQAAGFINIQVYHRTLSMHFDEPSRAEAFLTKELLRQPLLRMTDSTLREKFLHRVRAAIYEGGAMRSPFSMIAIYAERPPLVAM